MLCSYSLQHLPNYHFLISATVLLEQDSWLKGWAGQDGQPERPKLQYRLSSFSVETDLAMPASTPSLPLYTTTFLLSSNHLIFPWPFSLRFELLDAKKPASLWNVLINIFMHSIFMYLKHSLYVPLAAFLRENAHVWVAKLMCLTAHICCSEDI